MLSHVDIEQRIETDEVQVYYYFLRDCDGKLQYYPEGAKVVLGEADAPGTRFFRDRLFSDRLRITLGPIIKTHNPSSAPRRPTFRGRRDYTDIRQTNDELLLGPRETISVASNERIVLGPKTGALLLPRITLADAGIPLTVAYIDPFWDGTLQMILTNNTSSAHRLRLLETIAQCFFFDLSSPANTRFRSEFPRKSHHFGQTWKKVLDEDAEPFPQKKRREGTITAAQRFRAGVADIWSANSSWIKTLGLMGLVATGLIEAGRISSRISELEKFKDEASGLFPLFGKEAPYGLPGLKQSVDDVRAKLPVSGTRTIAITEGRAHGETTFTVQKGLSASRTLWAQPEAPNQDATVRTYIESISGDQVEIRITAALPSPAKQPTSVNVRWLLIP